MHPNNWVLTAGVQVNESAVNYAYKSTITGTYTNVGTYTGTIIISDTVFTFEDKTDVTLAGLTSPTTGNQRYLQIGSNLYKSLNNDYLIFNTTGMTLSEYSPAFSSVYIIATSYANASFYPYLAANPSVALTSAWDGRSWASGAFQITNQRFHIDLGSAKVITKIYYENNHNAGSTTTLGAKNFTLWGSNTQSAFDITIYSADTSWTQITGLSQTFFDQHSAANAVDPKFITITGSTNPYRYYAFKIADNWGFTDYMGIRRIELQGNNTNWVIQANTGVTPDLSATNYAFGNIIPGTFYVDGTWAGTPSLKRGEDTNIDILGQPRRMGTGTTLDCGAYEYSQVDMEWTTYRTVAPAVKITQAGYYTLTATVKAGVPKTVGCWAYFSGSTLPQIIAHSSEDILTITSGYTATAVGSTLTWEQLSLTFIPKASGFLQLSLYARDAATGSFTIFSDFSL